VRKREIRNMALGMEFGNDGTYRCPMNILEKKYFVTLMEGYKPAMIGGEFFRKNKHL
jgi:hypothetical protein